MLIFSFVIMVAISIAWLGYVGLYFSSRLVGVDFMSLGITDMSLYLLIAVVPIAMLWSLWGRFCSLRQSAMLQKQLSLLSGQIRQTQEYSDIVARILLKNGQQQAHAFALSKIELYISEMNEILYDILSRYNLLQENKLKELWQNVSLGNRWSFAKAFVDLHNHNEKFDDNLIALTKKHLLLNGSIAEFCARYTRLLGLLKDHDEENILQDIIETGVFGRVFAIFSTVMKKINKAEKITIKEDIKAEEGYAELKPEERFFYKIENSETTDSHDNDKFSSPHKNVLKKLWSKFFVHHEHDIEQENTPDPFSMALERSFGDNSKNIVTSTAKLSFLGPKTEDTPTASERDASIKFAATSNVKTTSANEKIAATKNSQNSGTRFAFSNTDKTIKNLQKEWEEMKKNDLLSSKREQQANE